MPIRAISLVPSITETLRAWGLDPIACTRFCEQPDLPTVGGTKQPDLEAIVRLGPDVVLLDEQENRWEDAEALAAAGLRVVALDVRELDGLDAQLARLADAVGLPRPSPVAPPGPAPSPGRRAFVPIWRRPWMTIGPRTYGASLLAWLGIASVFDDADHDYPETSLDGVARRRPELVIVPSEPYDFRAEHLAELAQVAPVIEVDGRDLFWWGARTPAALARLGRRLAAGTPAGGPHRRTPGRSPTITP